MYLLLSLMNNPYDANISIRRCALEWGKGCLLGTSTVRSDPNLTIEALLVTVIEGQNTVSVHGTPLALVRKQALALKLPLHVMHVPPQPSNATYETRFERALGPIRATGVRHVIAGDIHLHDVREYRKALIERIGMVPVFPLFGQSSDALPVNIVEAGVRAVVSSVDTSFTRRHPRLPAFS